MNQNWDRTSQTLLNRARDYGDSQAWNEMYQRYHPMMVRWSRQWLENPDDVADLNQIVWKTLAVKLKRFRYDPSKSFRAWLRTMHRNLMDDFVNKKKAYPVTADDWVRSIAAPETIPGLWTDLEWNPEEHDAFQARYAQVLERVEKRVKPKTWTLYKMIAFEGLELRETANRLEMTVAATFAAMSRVERMLLEEARKG